MSDSDADSVNTCPYCGIAIAREHNYSRNPALPARPMCEGWIVSSWESEGFATSICCNCARARGTEAKWDRIFCGSCSARPKIPVVFQCADCRTTVKHHDDDEVEMVTMTFGLGEEMEEARSMFFHVFEADIVGAFTHLFYGDASVDDHEILPVVLAKDGVEVRVERSEADRAVELWAEKKGELTSTLALLGLVGKPVLLRAAKVFSDSSKNDDAIDKCWGFYVSVDGYNGKQEFGHCSYCCRCAKARDIEGRTCVRCQMAAPCWDLTAAGSKPLDSEPQSRSRSILPPLGSRDQEANMLDLDSDGSAPPSSDPESQGDVSSLGSQDKALKPPHDSAVPASPMQSAPQAQRAEEQARREGERILREARARAEREREEVLEAARREAEAERQRVLAKAQREAAEVEAAAGRVKAEAEQAVRAARVEAEGIQQDARERAEVILRAANAEAESVREQHRQREEWVQTALQIRPARLEVMDEELGTGANGVVRRGLLFRGGGALDVAVKVMPGLVVEEERRRFDRELKHLVLASVSCHGVTQLFGTCTKALQGIGERLCLVMALYPSSLKRVLQEHGSALEEAQTFRYLTQLLRALQQLHALGIVHQDLKPDNLLISDHDEIVVGDFGISRTVTGTVGAIQPTSIAGTFNFMAPEAFSPEQFGGITPKADIWSVGGCLFQMVTGLEPFGGLPLQQIMMRVAVERRGPEPLPTASVFAGVLRQCFTYDPQKRPGAARLLEDVGGLRSSECAICAGSVPSTQGITCSGGHARAHFTCCECLCTFVTAACEASGAMVQSVREGALSSDAGSLPCPFFPRDCQDGSLSEVMVANLLTGAGAPTAHAVAGHCAWRCFVAAKGRVAVERYHQEQAAVEAVQARQREEVRADAVATAAVRVQEALLCGQAVSCPGCHNPKRKDDACIHMDCECGVHFCYVCGQDRYPGVVGIGSDYRAVNRRDCGCDRHSPYLHRQPGWGEFARTQLGESAAHGALIEFHRQRMAWFVRAASDSVAPQVWEEVQAAHPQLLDEVMEGRSITWAEVAHAEHPQFGVGNAGREAQRAAQALRDRW